MQCNPREGDGAGKHNLDGVVPELLELITTLSSDQQRSFLGILSKASVSQPKKRSRRQQREQQPAAGFLEAAPCQSKEQGTPTAPNAGVHGEKAKNVGIVETHLHRDTTGTFLIAFHYTNEIRQRTVDWIRTNCGMAYSRPVENMWLSGTEPWTRGLPVPSSVTLGTWLRADRKRLAATVEKRTLTKQQVSEGQELARRVQQEKLGASLVQLTPLQIQTNALEVSMNSVLRHLLENPGSEQRIFNILLVSKHMYAAATKTAVFRSFITDMLSTADFRRILREYELSQLLDSPELPQVCV